MQNQNEVQVAARLISRKEVEKLTSLSCSSIYLLMSENKFPRPIQIGSQRVAWVLSEINAWIDDRIANARVR
ncbi:AlpA family transcriptional regulator [Acinetobacter schindleri]|uniref:helix-turn-helix transcriptional regulator n=1 Tax=Acinetobacter schindleri TaxID=108981 RepID=UPI0013B07B7C|nr:AlpA family transcriptional regulator [Acinetobacter schindleri]QIC60174.1 AlpA family transcriptional regulator [Acinetobacter schindleri]